MLGSAALGTLWLFQSKLELTTCTNRGAYFYNRRINIDNGMGLKNNVNNRVSVDHLLSSITYDSSIGYVFCLL